MLYESNLKLTNKRFFKKPQSSSVLCVCVWKCGYKLKHVKSLDSTDAVMLNLRIWRAVCDGIAFTLHCEMHVCVFR